MNVWFLTWRQNDYCRCSRFRRLRRNTGFTPGVFVYGKVIVILNKKRCPRQSRGSRRSRMLCGLVAVEERLECQQCESYSETEPRWHRSCPRDERFVERRIWDQTEAGIDRLDSEDDSDDPDPYAESGVLASRCFWISWAHWFSLGWFRCLVLYREIGRVSTHQWSSFSVRVRP